MSLRSIRLSKEITKQEMADSLGVHVNSYSKWENNPEKISISNGVSICNILDIPFDTAIFSPKETTKM